MIENYLDENVKQDAVTQAEYMLSPDIPEEEFEHYVGILMLFNKNMKLGNIKEQWVPAFLAWFDVVNGLHKLGMYQEARQVISRLSCWNSISGGINGFTMLCQSGSLKKEYINDMRNLHNQTTRKGWTSKISGAFGNKNKEPPREGGEL